MAKPHKYKPHQMHAHELHHNSNQCTSLIRWVMLGLIFGTDVYLPFMTKTIPTLNTQIYQRTHKLHPQSYPVMPWDPLKVYYKLYTDSKFVGLSKRILDSLPPPIHCL